MATNMELSLDDTLKLIESVRIPPAPIVVQELHRVLQRDDTVLADIAEIVSRDVAISSLLLQAVNSPAYGLRRRARSIQHAAGLLGMANTTNIVAALALRNSLQSDNKRELKDFWDSASNIALAAAGIARHLESMAPDEAYMLGLFHNAGHTLMAQRFDDYAEFYEAHINDPNAPISELEIQRYRCNHCILGYYLARAWGLEPYRRELIRDHHDHSLLSDEAAMPDGSAGGQLAILKLAEHLDKLFRQVEPDYEWERCKTAVLDRLGFSELDYEDFREDMLEKLAIGDA